MKEAFPFVDTNVFLRHILNDDADHSPRATSYLGRVESGEVTVQTSIIAIFETIYVLQHIGRQPKSRVREILLPLIRLPGLILPEKPRILEALDLYGTVNIPFADAYHAVVAKENNVDIVSFDRDYDRVPGITRIEPP